MGQTRVMSTGNPAAHANASKLAQLLSEVLISHALDSVPKSDLLVRLDAPIEILEARLFPLDALPAAMPPLHRELARRL